MERSEEDKHRDTIEVFHSHLQNSVKRMQIQVSKRMQLDEMLQGCLNSNCRSLQDEAVNVIERVSARKGIDDDDGGDSRQIFGRKGKGRKMDFILEPEEFIVKKLTTIEEAVAFEKATSCMEDCRRPIDIVKRIMNSNVKEV